MRRQNPQEYPQLSPQLDPLDPLYKRVRPPSTPTCRVQELSKISRHAAGGAALVPIHDQDAGEVLERHDADVADVA
jgi:hypothetical protein